VGHQFQYCSRSYLVQRNTHVSSARRTPAAFPRCVDIPELNSWSISSLILDGGGIRGVSELLILQEIMERIRFQWNLDEEPLPCDYFDIIGGTGTGGSVIHLPTA
jgi:hypothetical protein